MASRGIDIPPVKPGDGVTESLLNQIVRGANRGRFTIGAGGVSANQIGSSTIINGNFQVPAEKNRLLMVNGTMDNSSLPGGLYVATMVVSSFWLTTDVDSDDLTDQVDGFPGCYFFNLAENGLTTHTIVTDQIIEGRFAGFTSDGVAVYCGTVPGASSSGSPYTLVGSITSPIVGMVAGVGTPGAALVTVPANSLVVGSILRITSAGSYWPKHFLFADETFDIRLFSTGHFSAVAIQCPNLAIKNGISNVLSWKTVWEFSINSIGVGGVGQLSIHSTIGDNTAFSDSTKLQQSNNRQLAESFNTTVAMVLDFQDNTTNGSMTLSQFSVELFKPS